jgi:putative endonuclease
MRTYWVYIAASQSRTLYTGVTNNIHARMEQHRDGKTKFVAKYRINRLVYVESTSDIRAAIAREKQIKGWTRAKKIALIASMNPAWDDLLPPDLSS